MPGVVVGLMWGIVSIGVYRVRVFASEAFEYSPAVPEDVQVSVCYGTDKCSSQAF